MQPFNTGLSGKATDDNDKITQDDNGDLVIFEDDEGDDEEEEEAEEADYEDNNINELVVLRKDGQTQVLEETTAICDTVTKVNNPITKQKMFTLSLLILSLIWVQKLVFVVIHSTTITHPAWFHICCEQYLKEQLIPHDAMTCWNSAYNMLKYVLAYQLAIDKITTNECLKLRRYELDNDNWAIVEDLVSSFKVHRSHSIYIEVQKSSSFLFTRFSQHCSHNTSYGQA